MTIKDSILSYQLHKTEWFNTETLKPFYGIKVVMGGKDIHLGDDDGFFKFATTEERDAKLEELKETFKQQNSEREEE